MANVTRYTGADKMIAKLLALASRTPDIFAKSLYQEAQIEVTECVKRTPRDTGALRASIHVEGPFREGRKISVAIAAGGPTAPYALIVHEDPDAIHPVGEWKYIENPLKESAPYMAERLAARIKQNWET